MPKLMMKPPPFTVAGAVTEILHGIPVTDPFRWLEDQNSRARASGLTPSMSTRVLISMASPDETAFGKGSENWWTSKLMTRSRRLGGATSSGNGSQDRNSSAFISVKAQTDQMRS